MKTLLVLARGDLKSFHTINGQSIFQDLPFKTVLLVDRGNQKQLAQLAGNLELVTVRWSDEDALKTNGGAITSTTSILWCRYS